MHLLRSVVFSLLAATSVAVPRGDGSRHQAIQPRATKYALKEPPLTTPWTDKVGTDPWPEYPRPQMQRSQWQNLNGIWQYRNASSLTEAQNPPFGQDLGQEVLIPSCLESGISGKTLNLQESVWRDLITYQCQHRHPGGLPSVLMVLKLVQGSVELERSADSAQFWSRRL